jgi:transcriptional regulator with XRE-family HTH domain
VTPGRALTVVREQSGLTYEQLARELEVTSGCVMKWKRSRELTLETVVSLLRFSSQRRLRCAGEFAGLLAASCGSRVRVMVR